jgi:hypothetical protein
VNTVPLIAADGQVASMNRVTHQTSKMTHAP